METSQFDTLALRVARLTTRRSLGRLVLGLPALVVALISGGLDPTAVEAEDDDHGSSHRRRRRRTRRKHRKNRLRRNKKHKKHKKHKRKTRCTPPCPDCQTCTGGTCTPVADGTPCDDGDACTQTATCQNGVCVGTDPVTCEEPATCCPAGTPNAGRCGRLAGSGPCSSDEECCSGVCGEFGCCPTCPDGCTCDIDTGGPSPSMRCRDNTEGSQTPCSTKSCPAGGEGCFDGICLKVCPPVD